MAIHFECVGCGRCCHGLRLPLSIAEAIGWLERGGTVDILCDAAPLAHVADPAAAFRRERSFPARSGVLEITVDMVLAASFEGACPNLMADMRCGIYHERPTTCRIYPAELNPARRIDPAARRCPAEAWDGALAMLADDRGVLVDPVAADTVDRARHGFAIDGPAKEHVAWRLGIDAAALTNEGYAVWKPDRARLLAALHAVTTADPDDHRPDWSWSFVSNRAATRHLIAGAGAAVAPIEGRAGLSFLPFFEDDTGVVSADTALSPVAAGGGAPTRSTEVTP